VLSDYQDHVCRLPLTDGQGYLPTYRGMRPFIYEPWVLLLARQSSFPVCNEIDDVKVTKIV